MFICGFDLVFATVAIKKIAASVSSQGVVAGTETLCRADDGATGGMNAIILLAHIIAAAKVRRQSLQVHIIE